ncbi:hypothetical protein Btru_065667 [Bulinus truncatus]|nr:hypothetical protein Btru_065667 [Bulinus truncatus]
MMKYLIKKAGVLMKKAGMLMKKAGVLMKKADVLMKKAGVLMKKAGVLMKKAGVLMKKAGVLMKKALVVAPISHSVYVDMYIDMYVSWLNPNNWCISSNQSGACDPTQTVLDVEKVPCTYDTVLFPRDHLYFVDLTDNFNVSLKSFKYQRTTFTSTSDLLQYFNSSDGKRIFQTRGGASPITIDRGQRCRYSRGCPCGNDRPEMTSLICHFVTCRRARCQNVIKPFGACCYLCGVVFNITSGAGFSLQKFTTDIRNKFLPPYGSGDVLLATSITYDNWVQLVLTDPTGEKSLKLGKEIEKELLLDLDQGGHEYSIDAMTMTSGSPIKPSAQQSQQLLKTSEITGIAVAVVGVFLIGVCIAIFLMYRGSGGKMTLPGLGNLARLFSRRIPRPTAHVMPGVFTASHIDPGFANPMYDRSSIHDEKVVFREMKVMGLADDVATFDISDKGFDNPMYGVQQPESEKGNVSVTATSGGSLSVNIQHHPMDSSI